MRATRRAAQPGNARVVARRRAPQRRRPGAPVPQTKEARRGKTRRRHLLFTAMALRPGLVFAEVVRLCVLSTDALPHRLHCLLHRRSRPSPLILRASAQSGAGEHGVTGLLKVNDASDATRGTARKRIGRRGIREAGAKNGLFDRWRHVAERCVSRVVELGSRKQPGVAVLRIDDARSAKRSLSRVVELGSRQAT